MDKPIRLESAKDLRDVSSLLILLPKDPTFETVAAGLGLYLSLEQAGKQVEIVCPTPMRVEANRLVGVQKVKTEVSGRNLVITFDYVKDAIEKVSYNVEDGKFNLVVVPKPGQSPLDYTNVSYNYSGVSGEAIVLVGTDDTSEVGQVVPHEENQAPKIFSVLPGKDRALASVIALLIAEIGIVPDADISTNLFQGLVHETENFQRASASDFETAAALVRQGASTSARDFKSSPEQSTEVISPKSDWLKPKIFSSGEERS